jgi:hypothetical protein
LPAPARFFGPGKARTAVLRRDREVFEHEEPFEVIAHADHSRRSYGRNIGVWRSKSILLASRTRAYCFDASLRRKVL